MNLKDRTGSGSQSSKRTGTGPQETELMQSSEDTMLKLNPQPENLLIQKQSETLQRQQGEIQQLTIKLQEKADTVKEMQTQINQLSRELETLKKKGRHQDIKKITDLSSEISGMNLILADLREELSSVRNINQSLAQSNDDLRNKGGLMTRKEQADLLNRCQALEMTSAELSDMVDMSNVEAVKSAREAQKEAERNAKKR